ncbi:MAG: TonB-dependent receptor [Pseudomonadota bacterium]
MKLLFIAIVIIAVSTAPIRVSAAQAGQITVDAQPLGAALNQLSEQTGVVIVAASDLVDGLQSNAISGSMTALEATRSMLADADLRAVLTANGAIVVSAAEPAPPEPELSPTAANQVDRRLKTIEEIVVRGQKLERSLIEVTTSVAITSEAEIRDLTLTDLTDVYKLTPNVNVDDSGEGTFSIRGISYAGIGFAGVSNTASLYVDEVFQSNLGIEAGPLSTFDVRDVEIFRGPQSTLQGRNALAGAIMVHTNDPTYEWDATARIQVAEFATRRYSFAGGGPLLDDQLAFRVAIDEFESDGYIDNPTIDRDDVDSEETTNIRTKLLWEPNERFSALFTYIYSEGFAGTGFGTGAVEGPDFAAREVNYDNVTLLDIDTQNYAATLSYDLTDKTTVELVATYTDAEEDSAPRLAVDPATSTGRDIGSDAEQVTTVDLRLLHESDSLSLLGGLYYFDRDQERDRDLSALLTLGPFSTTLNFLEVGGTQNENMAIYFDGEYQINDRIALLFGARYDEEDFAVDSQSSTTFTPEFPPLAVSSQGGRLVADTTFTAFLPKLGIRYALADNQSLGFVIQRGYRPGGAGTNLSNQQFEFDPEFLVNYELSYRANWLEDTLQFNANLYYTDWDDQQANVGEGINIITVNAGESRLFGAEFDLRWQPNPNVNIFLAAAFNNTEFTDFDTVDPTLTGNEFPSAPDFQVSSGAVVSLPAGFFFSVDASYTDGSFSDTVNAPSEAVPFDNRNGSYTLVNAKIGYQSDRWLVNLFARNLFDEDYTLRISRGDVRSLGEGFATVGPPQIIGLEVYFDL